MASDVRAKAGRLTFVRLVPSSEDTYSFGHCVVVAVYVLGHLTDARRSVIEGVTGYTSLIAA